MICNFNRKSFGFRLIRDAFRLQLCITKRCLTSNCNIIAPLNVGQRVIMQVTLENLIRCVGAGAIIDCDCICFVGVVVAANAGTAMASASVSAASSAMSFFMYFIGFMSPCSNILVCIVHNSGGVISNFYPPEWLRLLMRYPNISAMPIIRAPAAAYGGVPAAPVAGSS